MDSTPYSTFENQESPTRPWTITIRPVSNGYIVDDGDTTEVIEESDREHGEVYAAAHLLWRVLEMVGHYGSKHDLARVRIRIEDSEGQEIGPE